MLQFIIEPRLDGARLRLSLVFFAFVLALPGAMAGVSETGLRLADPDVIAQLREIDDPGLPKNLTPGERPHLRLPDLSRVPRDPPVADFLFTAAEFERNEAIIMRWGNFNSVLTEMIVPITTGDSLARVLLVVASSAQQSSAASALAFGGANLDRVDFVIAPSNSVWIRDYGPRFSSADNERIIVDHNYNRPRPLDNQVPAAIAAYLDEALFDMPIAHGGGNFHLFANGEAYMTDLIVDENPGYTAQDVIDLYADYQGVDLTLLPALPASFDSTQHLDMWFLPVDDQTVIIGEYNEAEAGGMPYQVTEYTAALMESRGYTVFRTPGWRGQQGFSIAHHTYTNAVIVNDIVLMCRFNGYASQNAQAQAVFEQAFPGMDIVPVDCSEVIRSSGALHCIVKHKPAPAFRLDIDQPAATACVPDSGSKELSFNVSLQAINNFGNPVSLLTLNLPDGVTSQFSPAPLTPPGESTWTLTIDSGASAGTSEINLFGNDRGGPSLPTGFSLTLESVPSGPGLTSPPDLAEAVGFQPVLEWQGLAGAIQYRVQLATDPDFDNLLIDERVEGILLGLDQELDSGVMHYWRVLAENNCGDGDWSLTRQFRTRFDPVAEVNPGELGFELYPDDTIMATLAIANVGNGELEWSIATQACSNPQTVPWLSVDSASGATVAGQSSMVEVSVNTSGLAPGSYAAGLCLTTNEFNAQAVSLPVLLEVLALPGQLLIEPGLLAFGEVASGRSDWRDLVLSNVADADAADLSLETVEVVAAQSVFSVDEQGSDCGQALRAQAECTIRVRFSPDDVAAYSGTLLLLVDGEVSNIELVGEGVELEPLLFRDRFQAEVDD